MEKNCFEICNAMVEIKSYMRLDKWWQHFHFCLNYSFKQQKQTTVEFNHAPARRYSKHCRSQRQSAVGLNYFLSLEISFIRAESNSGVWIRLRSQRIAAAMNVHRLWQRWISPSMSGLMCVHLIPTIFLCWRRKLSSNCQHWVFLRFRGFSCCLILQAASHRSFSSVSRSVGFYTSNSNSQKKYEVITTVSVFPCTKA